MSNIIQIINARLVDGSNLTTKPLWFNSEKGVFISPPNPTPPSTSIIDLQNRIVSPGFIDLQINGAYGFDFSEDIAGDVNGYLERYKDARRKLVATGTTSFLPTMTSQFPERYHQVCTILHSFFELFNPWSSKSSVWPSQHQWFNVNYNNDSND